MNKIATLVGCAIGDALGQSFEMLPANNLQLQNWDGFFREGATFWKRTNRYQYSDDTLMTMVLSASLLEKNGFDPEDVAKKYLAWYNSGNTRGIGSTTAGSIMHLKLGATWQESGATHMHDGRPVGGNGTAMRVSPIGLYYRKDPIALMKFAMMDASITHNSFEPKMGSVAVALAVAMLANRTSTPESVSYEVTDILADSEVKTKIELAQKWLEQGTDLSTVHFEALAEIGTSGYVAETVGAAFYCLGATDNFRDAVVVAVRAGGDTDTTAAIVGAMAGTYYGLDSIPSEYKDQVENFELLQALTDELINNEI
jgi:ADP-ribosyl-[dinitrogen reductase] hydrolase